MEGETRTVTYDKVSLYNGEDGYSLVDPNGGDLPSSSITSSIVHITKRNATGFAIDGNKGGANGQDVYLWSESGTNENQQWLEIDRGNGYYSYQKVGTDFALDGGKGGADRQNVYLWTVEEDNYNQHWKKVDLGNGAFQLVKRNAPSFALNGGGSGSNGQSITLFDSSNSSENLQWYITPVENSSAKSLKIIKNEEVVIYPNPVVSTITIKGAGSKLIRVYDINGKVVMVQNILNDIENLDLSTLSKGIYYAQINGIESTSVIKLIKQ